MKSPPFVAKQICWKTAACLSFTEQKILKCFWVNFHRPQYYKVHATLGFVKVGHQAGRSIRSLLYDKVLSKTTRNFMQWSGQAVPVFFSPIPKACLHNYEQRVPKQTPCRFGLLWHLGLSENIYCFASLAMPRSRALQQLQFVSASLRVLQRFPKDFCESRPLRDRGLAMIKRTDTVQWHIYDLLTTRCLNLEIDLHIIPAFVSI